MTYEIRINSYIPQKILQNENLFKKKVLVECLLTWSGEQQHIPVRIMQPIRGAKREQLGYKISANGTLDTRNELILENGNFKPII